MPVTRLRTQRSCRFAKHEKLAILGNLAEGGAHEKFWEKLKVWNWLKVTYFVKNEALMTML